jgi:2-polyprenyl-3-methyl-5-hydroxy-6-metoxy-1,4-benzoquinol methylase
MKEQQWLEDGWFYHNHAWHLLHEFLKLIREVENAESLLDVGAGTGLAAAVIGAVFPDITHVEVTDIEEKCLKFWDARKLYGWVGPEDNSFKSKYDIVISSHVLEHVDKPLSFIQKLFNITKKRLIIAIPDGPVNCYDHKIVYDRIKLETTIREALEGQEYKYKGFPVYHAHMNNLITVVDKC